MRASRSRLLRSSSREPLPAALAPILILSALFVLLALCSLVTARFGTDGAAAPVLGLEFPVGLWSMLTGLCAALLALDFWTVWTRPQRDLKRLLLPVFGMVLAIVLRTAVSLA